MKCPNCLCEFNINEYSKIKAIEILDEISKSPHNISSLSKKLSIKRSTLRYYITLLISEGKIKLKRLENFAGRPVILMVQEKV